MRGTRYVGRSTLLPRWQLACLAGLAMALVLWRPGQAWAQAPVQKWALVIGVSKYTNAIPTVAYADADAVSLVQALQECSGFERDHITLLTSTSDAAHQPTRANIRSALTQMVSRMKAGDAVVIYFAGHGFEVGGSHYLATMDARLEDLPGTTVSTASLRDYVKEMKASTVLIIADACRNDPYKTRTTQGQTARRVLSRNLVNSLTFQPSSAGQLVCTLFACRPGQKSYDSEARKHGYFTWHLMDGLRGGAADAQGRVTLPALASYVETHVNADVTAHEKDEQLPWLQSDGPGLGGLVLAVTPPGGKGAAGPSPAPAAVTTPSLAAPPRPVASSSPAPPPTGSLQDRVSQLDRVLGSMQTHPGTPSAGGPSPGTPAPTPPPASGSTFRPSSVASPSTPPEGARPASPPASPPEGARPVSTQAGSVHRPSTTPPPDPGPGPRPPAASGVTSAGAVGPAGPYDEAAIRAAVTTVAQAGCTLQVECPTDAIVFVDMIMREQPVRLSVAPGPHKVRVTRGERYCPFEVAVQVAADQLVRVAPPFRLSAAGYYHEGLAAWRSGNRAQARLHFDESLRAPGKKIPEASFYVGLLARSQSDIKGAEAAFFQYVNFKDASPSGHYQLGLVRQKLGGVGPAATQYKLALYRLCPELEIASRSGDKPTTAQVDKLKGSADLRDRARLAYALELRGQLAESCALFRALVEDLATRHQVDLEQPVPDKIPLRL